ncbi:MAG: threonylcarbamoyl-AMP synthase [Candidatus Rokubacteria bacterium]|nr:threonylcarbamoyl-AMP synthase [Candidatus Rokubacteria bacterium]MBI3827231.1 threonylcarbamoyl-AMP synthase [Candidatus Rokubacteria bacterium]
MKPGALGVRVRTISSSAPDDACLGEAAAVLARGGLVAFPTETFYGLGAMALDPAAVRRVVEAKGRPESKPVLLLVDSIAMVERLATEITPAARALMHRHWPGALTLVVRARAEVPVEVTAGTGTVGVRLSPHPVATGLVRALGRPITAPSANPSGSAPPTTAREVLEALAGALDLVLDGGPTAGGAASTVLDVTGDPPRVIRRGPIAP